MNGKRMYPSPESCKKAYRFKLGTTSFIHPDHIVPNVEALGHCLDEIELLLFESENLPSRQVIETLRFLAEELDLSYNVHLPTDISITDRESLASYIHAIKLTLPLSPSTYTLHIPHSGNMEHDRWTGLARENIGKLLLDSGMKSRAVSIENLDYPFEWIADTVSDLNLSVCMDTGHLIMYDFDHVVDFFEKYQ
ncbi:MAG: hypothetical protein GY765_32625, partial [bacterium]|nr:hypothetical protein [bacterium]